MAVSRQLQPRGSVSIDRFCTFMLPPGQFFGANVKSSGLLPSLVSYRTLAHLYMIRREVVSGAWNSFARNSQSGAIYTLRAGLSRWGAWQWAAHAPVSQAALNYRSCGIDDAILP